MAAADLFRHQQEPLVVVLERSLRKENVVTVFEKPRIPDYMICKNVIIAPWIVILCLSLSGCFRQAESVRPRPDLFWPGAPEVKRIRFVNAISTPENLNIHPGIFQRLFTYIVGHPAAAIVTPYGISSDSRGRLYVVDTFLKRVHVFDADGNTYSTFPTDGALLAAPVGIAVDQRGFIYVTDAKQGVVDIFKAVGNEFESELGRGVFKRPTGIAVNPKTSELLVVDTLQSRVFRFDLTSRMQKGSFGGDGMANGRFHYPTTVSVTPAGHIIVSDSLNFRIQVFSPEGIYLYKFGQMGHEPGTFSRPKGVASDSDGNIYVVDALFDNIQVFDTMGRLLLSFGDHGAGYGEFWLPSGIYIDETDAIYVSDSSNQRVQVFQYLKDVVE